MWIRGKEVELAMGSTRMSRIKFRREARLRGFGHMQRRDREDGEVESVRQEVWD